MKEQYKRFGQILSELKQVVDYDNSKVTLNINDIIDSIICTSDEFFTILNLKEGKLEYLSENFETLLGYSSKNASWEIMFECLYPEDRKVVIEITNRAMEYLARFETEPFRDLFELKYRLVDAKGNVFWFTDQSTALITDKYGNVILLFTLYSKIDKFKTPKTITCSYSGPHAGIYKQVIDKFKNLSSQGLSKRENDIIKALCSGDNSEIIAHKLNISKHTVDTHRRNILSKLSLKNVAELVSFAKEKGLV